MFNLPYVFRAVTVRLLALTCYEHARDTVSILYGGIFPNKPFNPTNITPKGVTNMSIVLNRAWMYELYINNVLYTLCETREQALSTWAEYKRNLRYGRGF